jgi:hypothetical protein
VYIVVNNKYPAKKGYDESLYRYNLKTQQFIKDDNQSEVTPLPIQEESKSIRFAVGKDGVTYIGFISGALSILTYDKNMSQLAEPAFVYGVFDGGSYQGQYQMDATDKGVDVWNVYDARVINGEHYEKPVNIGVNHFSFSLN